MQPFVKWVGGKRQLLHEIEKRLPEKYNNYFEPFVGGGALLFHLEPENAFINDINPILIHTYKIIQKDPTELIKNLYQLENQTWTKEMYLKEREKFNHKIINNIFDVELSSLFIFINKKCFNGLFRVNSKGLFNVPFNYNTNGKIFDEDNLWRIHHFLKRVKITNFDFEEALKEVQKGDFIFLDSPYVPLNSSSFEEYTKDGFSLSEHLRLAKLFKELDKKGCYVMMTNHNTDFIYENYSKYHIDVLKVKRMINSKADKRYGEEVIITNYEFKK
ncbi:DNA adenine methylase [Mycoplasma buteonis]|uniref:DNA adenine methylase n=1 Tax=Mycoplasma buteonis TaxID=171280 RepID=UPI000567B68E|nr:Dam family site-specific DNA-(adenine-N6)-methyltransferase [Mycoplasma buteonis]